ncbi:MAG: YraN family protein, partial [Planctomycetes bacterium]|nr:YraN family protein [Planctomycetota bacterium]
MRALLERFLGGGLGRRGERAAARHLRRQGLRILARNVREGRGEIDLVALDGATLVFVEVK